MKQIEPNPWALIEEKYPVGTRVNGEIRNITNFGVFVGLEEGIDGLVHVSDISWTEQIKHPSEKFEKGDVVEAVVLKIDRENEKFSLGIKQLEANPWDDIQKKYPVGSEINGEITNVTDFGAFVKLEEGIEGLIYSSELSEERVEKPSDVVQRWPDGDRADHEGRPGRPEDLALDQGASRIKRAAGVVEEAGCAAEPETQTTTFGDLLASKEKLEGKGETIRDRSRPDGGLWLVVGRGEDGSILGVSRTPAVRCGGKDDQERADRAGGRADTAHLEEGHGDRGQHDLRLDDRGPEAGAADRDSRLRQLPGEDS